MVGRFASLKIYENTQQSVYRSCVEYRSYKLILTVKYLSIWYLKMQTTQTSNFEVRINNLNIVNLSM